MTLPSPSELAALLAAGTARPWVAQSFTLHSERDGEGIGALERRQDAALIVTAVNSLEALAAIYQAAEKLRTAWLDTSGSASSVDAITDACREVIAALDRAKGTP